MVHKLVSRGVAAACIALAGCAAKAPTRFDQDAPVGHVMLPGEALDPSAAYVAIVPHLSNRTGKARG